MTVHRFLLSTLVLLLSASSLHFRVTPPHYTCLLYASSSSSALSRLHGPPTDIIQRGNGGSGENGFRQLTKTELSNYLSTAQRSLGLVGGSVKLEIYEMLQLMEKLSLAMPGQKPHRNELLAYGHFVDGRIESTCGVGVCKVLCPWEMEVLALVNSPKMNKEAIETMLSFISEMCKDNACLPSFEELKRYDSLRQSVSKIEKESTRNGIAQPESPLSPYSHLYEEANKALAVSLTTTSGVVLNPFWFVVEVGHNQIPGVKVPVYLRQKTSNTPNEFEILFRRPQVGVSNYCGNVGGFVILRDGPTALQVCPNATPQFFSNLACELGGKLNHPRI